MSIPGSNLLKMALRAIKPQEVQYFQATSRTLNDVGQWDTTYDKGETILGSFQAVPRSMYSYLGLDFAKNYVNFYSSTPVKDVGRNRTGDQLAFGGQRFEVESKNNWDKIDGWNAVLCVEIALEPENC